MNETRVEPGVYLHFKGNCYEVIETVRSRTLGTLVVYRAVGGDQLFARPEAEFLEAVLTRSGLTPRFAPCQGAFPVPQSGLVGE